MIWVVFALLSAIFFSIRDILSKKLLKTHDSIVILFNSSILVTLIVLALFYDSINFVLPFSMVGVLIIKSLLVALGWYFLLEAYKHLEISTAAPLLNLSPIILLFLGIIFLGESLSLLQVIGFIILIIGAYALELKSLSDFSGPLKLFKHKSVLFIFISLISLSFSAVLDKILSLQISTYTIIFSNSFVISIVSFIIILFRRELSDLVSVLKEFPLQTLFFGVTTVLSDVAYFFAVTTPGALITLIMPIKRLSTVFTTIVGGRMFKEERFIYKALISLFMVIGILCLVI